MLAVIQAVFFFETLEAMLCSHTASRRGISGSLGWWRKKKIGRYCGELGRLIFWVQNGP